MVASLIRYLWWFFWFYGNVVLGWLKCHYIIQVKTDVQRKGESIQLARIVVEYTLFGKLPIIITIATWPLLQHFLSNWFGGLCGVLIPVIPVIIGIIKGRSTNALTGAFRTS